MFLVRGVLSMSLPVKVLQKLKQQPVSFIETRSNLNLPRCDSKFPFSFRQREAIELALSNCPLAVIAGNPASGKTEIAKAVLTTAIKHQRSTLIISPYQSSLNQYQGLFLTPLQITNEQEYHQRVKDWLQLKLQNPSINFTPPYLLPDILFDSLQINGQKWLDLIENGSQEILEQEVKKTFLKISDARCFLLVQKLQKFPKLIAQRELLKQNYQNLSDTALEELTTLTLNTMPFPVLCLSDDLELLTDKIFDLVIVEDSHYLEEETINTVAHLSKKLVLLGELHGDIYNFFRELFNQISPAYRLEIKENYRLVTDLAVKIFPHLYYYYPYGSVLDKLTNQNNQKENNLIWHDVVNLQQMIITLGQYLIKNPNYKLLTFSENTSNMIKTQFKENSTTLTIKSINHWYGEECNNLLIICNKNDLCQPSQKQLQLALTRAKNSIIILGDKTYYENSVFSTFFEQNLFQIRRDLALKQNPVELS
jgi:hypothetical protein